MSFKNHPAKKSYSRILLMLVFVLIGLKSFSQQYFFRQYSQNEGLLHSTVYAIEQDKYKYLWIGTYGGGVCSFDGKNFKEYSKTDGLCDNNVRSIYCHSNGEIWIGTEKGISIFNGATFRNITKENGLNETVILNFFEDSNHDMWTLTSGGGINIIKAPFTDSLQFEYITLKNGLTSNLVTDVVKDKNNRFWVSALGGIAVLEYVGDKIRVVNKIQENLENEIVWDLEKQGNDTLWISTYYEGGVYFLKNFANNKTSPFTKFDKLKSTETGTILKILSDTSGKLWFATNKNGIYSYYNENLKNYSANNGLPGNQVYTLFIDLEKNLWAGTMESGLICFPGETFVEYPKNFGKGFDQLTCLEFLDSNTLLVGSNAGPSKYNISGNKLINQPIRYPAVNSSNISDIAVVDNNHFYLATANEGIFCIKNGTVSRITQKDGLPDNTINCIHCATDGKLWVGTSSGYSMYNGETFFNMDENNSFINNEIQTIIEDKSGAIWMGTLGGLVRIKGDQYQDFNEEDGLVELRIHALAENSNGNIFIGTFGDGIYEYSATDSIPIHKIADKDVLSSNNIYSLCLLDKNTLIVGTDNRFNELHLDNLGRIADVYSFNESDGFMGTKIFLNAIKSNDPQIAWFGTNNGLIKYNRQQLNTHYDPEICITEVKLNDEKIDWNDFSNTKHNWFGLPEHPVFRYNQNNLSFQVSGISFINPEKVKIQYRIPTIRKSWLNINGNMITTDPNPAKHNLEIRLLIDNKIQPNQLTYSFVIKPPFWETWWFYSIVVILLIALMILYINYRERKLKEDKQKLEKAVKDRTKEIEQQKEIVEYQKQQITDSIIYAKRIQEAVLPRLQSIDEFFPANFVLFKPRDYVSGDFYWAGKMKENIMFTAADCTGHGVPGAFMSMLGISFLNEISNEKKDYMPNEILERLRKKIIEALKQEDSYAKTKDGMDIALCTYNQKSKTLYYSGANNSLILIRNGELFEYKADKMPVAIHWVMEPFNVETIQVQDGDCIYLFSDGYRDQFGGPKKKKFMFKNFKGLLLKASSFEMIEQKNLLEETFESWQGDQEQIDDVIVMGIKF